MHKLTDGLTATEPECDLAGHPGGVIARTDEFELQSRVELHREALHDPGHLWPKQRETVLGHAAHKRVARLSHCRIRMHHAVDEELEDVRLAAHYALLELHPEALHQPTENIEGGDE